MKTSITKLALAAFIMSAAICHATTRTVSNDPVGGAQFAGLQAAKDASVNGDTLLLDGTNIPYVLNTLTLWDKSLVVIGIGFNPQKQNPRHSIIGLTPQSGVFSIASAGSGSRFYGIEFASEVIFGGAISSASFEDCKFNSDLNTAVNSVSNLIVKNCVILGNGSDQCFQFSPNLTTNSNILISNCSLNGYIDGNNNTILALTVDHCLFLGSAEAPLERLQNALVKNSIFMNNATTQITSAGITYSNDISRLGTVPSGTGNINTTNPNFVTYSLNNLYSASWDFHLQAGSAAIGAASDGTDIGIHGGFSNFSEKGEVLITPIVRSMIINNTTVVPNGTLSVQVNATKPTDN